MGKTDQSEGPDSVMYRLGQSLFWGVACVCVEGPGGDVPRLSIISIAMRSMCHDGEETRPALARECKQVKDVIAGTIFFLGM